MPDPDRTFQLLGEEEALPDEVLAKLEARDRGPDARPARPPSPPAAELPPAGGSGRVR